MNSATSYGQGGKDNADKAPHEKGGKRLVRKTNQAQPIDPVHARLKNHRCRACQQAVEARLHNATRLLGQFLKNADEKY